MSISAANRKLVIQRAGGCCEYCRRAQTDETSPFNIDHIVPIKHGGTDTPDNLCLSCFQCNSYKGSNMAAADPLTGDAAFLFNPRTQLWNEHFFIGSDASIIGKTAIGRVTVKVMRMNEDARIQYRQFAIHINEYPCKTS